MPSLEIEIRAFGEHSEVDSAQAADIVAAAFIREHWNVTVESSVGVQQWRAGCPIALWGRDPLASLPNGVVRIKVED